jgi:hypothetical protein
MKPELIIAIVVIAICVVVFIVSYVLNKKTPLPKGCENIHLEDETCLACSKADCHIKEDLLIKINELKEKEGK